MADKTEDLYRPEQRNQTAQQSILIMTANNTEDLEFFYPYYRLIESGFKVDVVTPDGGEFKAKHGLGLKETGKIKEARPDKYVMLYIPGGKAPAELKNNHDAIDFVRAFAASKKPIAAICHGPQLLAAANVIHGRKIASWPEVKNEISEAGAEYVNEETVVDGQFITARWPGDLPMHLKATIKELERAGHFALPKKSVA